MWLEFARADLEVAAEHGHVNRWVVGIRCYHCQQAAEKALKAVIDHYGGDVPHFHNLVDLMQIASSTNDLPDGASEWRTLNAYIVATRYPDALHEATDDDLAEALELARAVVAWATSVIETAT